MAQNLAEQAVRYGAYPGVLAACAGGAHALITTGTSPSLVVVGVSLGLIPVCLALELAFPETPRWRLARGEAFADLLHMLLSNPVPTAIFRALLFGWFVAVSDTLSAALGFGLWPRAWPLAAQGLLVLGVAELVNYGIHRGLHESRLWPLHAVHHCSPRMYFLLSVRKHPLQAFLTYGGRLSVLWLLGVTPEAFALYTVFVSANSFLQHANVCMATGPLGAVLATPELHRLHHSSRPEEIDTNYGDSLILWDRLFGSFRAPDPSRPLHASIGLPGLEVPQTYAAHLRLPFVWSRLQTDDPARPPR
jgi:sterol desaturase/sphingolipid hydroxylase (fatty acid hydroxylase superfamily)